MNFLSSSKSLKTLERFIIAQDECFENVINELKNGKKRTHWIWYIFPQCEGLGRSSISIEYSIKSKQEAINYFNNETLHYRLIACCKILLESKCHNIIDILGFPDDLKFKSCLTLFMNINPQHLIFKELLVKYFEGQQCSHTRNFLNLKKNL